MSFKHNKKKNSLVVFEQLTTLASRLASQKKEEEFNFVLEFIKRKFNPNTQMGRERKILSSLTETNCKENESEDLIKEALVESIFIDSKELEKEKSSLINEINNVFGSELFKIPIKKYKLYASAQILVNEHKNDFKNTNAKERLKIKSILKENLTKKIEKDSIEENIDNVTYKILINKFNKRYGPLINEDQKMILSGWVNYLITKNDAEFRNLLIEKSKKITKTLKKECSKKREDKDYSQLLNEGYEAIKSKNFTQINEEVVYDVMRYFDIIQDLESE